MVGGAPVVGLTPPPASRLGSDSQLAGPHDEVGGTQRMASDQASPASARSAAGSSSVSTAKPARLRLANRPVSVSIRSGSPRSSATDHVTGLVSHQARRSTGSPPAGSSMTKAG